MDTAATYTDLLRSVREHAVLASAASVLEWDEQTNLPPQGSAHRGEQMALLARLGHEMFTDPAIGERLAHIEGSELVREPESDAAANVREIRRQYNRAVKLPKELVEELARVTARARPAWVEARKKSDFAVFLPW